jgi:hypothetical protein
MMDNAVSGAMQGKTMEAAGESIGEGPTAPHPFAKAQVTSSRPDAAAETQEIKSSFKDEATAGESTED